MHFAVRSIYAKTMYNSAANGTDVFIIEQDKTNSKNILIDKIQFPIDVIKWDEFLSLLNGYRITSKLEWFSNNNENF